MDEETNRLIRNELAKIEWHLDIVADLELSTPGNSEISDALAGMYNLLAGMYNFLGNLNEQYK